MVSILQDWVLQLVSIDLALRSLFEHNCSDEDDELPTKRVKLHHNDGACDDIKPVPSTEGRETGKKLIVSGLAIALCCHHRCDWRQYVGKEFFRQKGLGPEEFAAFQRMSSWATCGMRKFGSKITEKPSKQMKRKNMRWARKLYQIPSTGEFSGDRPIQISLRSWSHL